MEMGRKGNALLATKYVARFGEQWAGLSDRGQHILVPKLRDAELCESIYIAELEGEVLAALGHGKYTVVEINTEEICDT